MNGDLEAWYNGQELVSNLKSGHSDHFKTAYQTLWGVGGLQVFFGLFTALVMGNAISTNDTRDFSIEVFVLGFIPFIGLVNIGLGFWAQRLNVKTPLMIGIFLILLLGLTFNLFAYVAIAGISYIFYKGIKAPIISYSDEEVTINEDTPLDQM
jgi:hypothetical protein